MLEKPEIPDKKIIACLHDEFGIEISEIMFLPIGADADSIVYRADTEANNSFFVKLRRDGFEEVVVRIPKFLHEQGISQVIPPWETRSGELWTNLDGFNLVLYPFIDGQDGYAVELSDRQWMEFGATLKRIHDIEVPTILADRIQTEKFTGRFRETVRNFMDQLENNVYEDPVSKRTALLLQAKQVEIYDLLKKADRLALALQSQTLEQVLCHTDLHAGNILIDGRNNLYIVDWDGPIFAPRERDLMYIGGGQGFRGHTPQQEENLFYKGYGQTRINQDALAYYRYERIIEDIAAYCEQLLMTKEGGADREQSFQYLYSNFLPGNTLEIAYRSDMSARS